MTNNTHIAIADLHGHLDAFEAMLIYIDAHYPDVILVTLGDYCDNGKQIPELIDRLIELCEERGEHFIPVLGNHDLACLRVLGWPGGSPDEGWYKQWSSHYWNSGLGTAPAYGAHNATMFMKKMPKNHQIFLESLPWFYKTDHYLFVHAGMKEGPLGPQLEALARKALPTKHTFLPPQIRDKSLATVADPSWDREVISAHTKFPTGYGKIGVAKHFVGPNRICISGDVDSAGTLHALVLPARRILTVTPSLQLLDEPLAQEPPMNAETA